MLSDMESQVTARHQINDQVKVVTVFKGVVHVHEELMIELAQKFLFIHYRVHTSL